MIAFAAATLGAMGASAPHADPAGAARIDHSAFDTLLARYVDDDGGVRYAAWKRDDDDALDVYLDAMSAVDPAALADTTELLAYWINVYNALTIDAILHFYPVASIKDKVAMFGYNVWDDYTITIAGQERSLNDIEHKILRKLDEPRIHFAIVCASLGCPHLRNDAYTGPSLGEQLDAATREFFANPQHIQFDTVANTVRLSRIFDWFGDDFGGSDAAKRAFISRFVASDAERQFLHSKAARIEYLDYDWRLNEAK
ncbi:MAG: DUF547 domain-containing protein [bacterium]